ncbi:MAG: 4Fe-4S binding protein [Firmicutes bacterium]|nr:4Fe-4S binding protein [Bacillota bacterium]
MAVVNVEKCTGCGNCVPYCTVRAIRVEDKMARIDPGCCTECYVCMREKVCPVGAIEAQPLVGFGEIFKHTLSDPTETLKETGVPGRGTEEAKTNDVTGRFRPGEVGVCIDLGRPGVGTSMRDVEKVAMAVTAAGLEIEGPENSPIGLVLKDRATGRLQEEVLDQYLLSMIVEGKCPVSGLPKVLEALREVEKQIDTVFSLGLVARTDANGHTPVLEILEELGLPRPIRGKVNVGLGRPLAG